HSPVMDALEDELRSALADLRPRTPSIPTVSTVTGKRVDADMLHDADYWWRNVRQSVRFADGLETALGLGANIFVEVGPHPVLASSIRSVVRDSETDAHISPTLVRKKDEMATITRTTRRLWTAGVEIDWDAYLGGGRHVKLPTYPWQREHHWTESIRSERHRLDRSDHPFLMTPQTSAHPTWETEINLAHMPWLADHVVAGSNLFPGAGYVEAFTAVHHALALRDDEQPGVGCTLEDITFDQPVLLRPGANAVVSLETAADTKKIVAYQQVDQTSWQPCASAKHYPRHRRAERVDLDAVEARLSDEMSPDALYDRLGERGLVYGPSFRAVGSLLHGKDEVLARLELPESVATGTDALEDYYLHPVLLDAGFHSLIAAALQREDASDRELVPVSVASVTVFEHASCEHTAQRLIAHGRLTELDDRRLRGDITLCTEAGEVVAIVEDFTCKALQRQQAVFDERFESWTYAQNWHPLPQQAPADAGPTRWLLLGAEPGLTADTPDSEDTWVAVDDLAELEQHLLEQHLLEQHLEESSEQPIHVVDLRALASSEDQESQAPTQTGTDHAARLLRTIQSIEAGRVERYFVLTAGAHSVGEETSAGDLGLSPLVGLSRTAMTERPDLRLTRVDLETRTPSVELLADLLAGVGPEQEIAVRDATPYVCRIEQVDLATPPAESVSADDVEAYELSLGAPGRFDEIGFRATARRQPAPDEVEIEVAVTPLGFKDVMKTLGLLSERVTRDTYIGEAIGMEGAGTVVAVGDDVTDFEVGDRVYGVHPGFLRSHVTMPARHCVRLPDNVSFADGSNLIVFLTVYLSLVEIADLQPGERLLVHGATGGIGLAALEIADWLGAEIYATAGNDQKRDYLRERGIDHVSDSRSVAFADDVMEWTDGDGVDVVLNFTPGDIMRKGISCLAPFGRFIELGKMSFEQDEALNLRPFNEHLTYASVDFDRYLARKPEAVQRLYRDVFARLESGDFEAHPTTVFEAGRAGEAFRTMARSTHIGKIAVDLRDPDLEVAPEHPTLFDADKTYLITGGLGGFGAEVARWMADRGARHLALVSRSGAAKEGADVLLQELREAGAEPQAFAADVSDRAELAATLDAIAEEMPPLGGVMHGAMVLDDKPLAELDRASLERVMAAKAHGAWLLHTLTEEMPLEFMVFFSSVSSLVGNAGQANYVAANAFLDQLAD
ncbi:MAG: SDR family NAD(P)-dependent oxidoreductase, partial [Persicimonas sp.]